MSEKPFVTITADYDARHNGKKGIDVRLRETPHRTAQIAATLTRESLLTMLAMFPESETNTVSSGLELVIRDDGVAALRLDATHIDILAFTITSDEDAPTDEAPRNGAHQMRAAVVLHPRVSPDIRAKLDKMRWLKVLEHVVDGALPADTYAAVVPISSRQ